MFHPFFKHCKNTIDPDSLRTTAATAAAVDGNKSFNIDGSWASGRMTFYHADSLCGQNTGPADRSVVRTRPQKRGRASKAGLRSSWVLPKPGWPWYLPLAG